MLHLSWHGYSYFPYERELALREVQALIGCDAQEHEDGGLLVPNNEATSHVATRLTYFSGLQAGRSFVATTQGLLEDAARTGRSRQATRYSAHGLHEYKGKFNPQVARAILNIFGAGPGKRVLDPFCGSGTTLVEGAHLRSEVVGTDVNPLAVYLSEAKLASLATPAGDLRLAFRETLKLMRRGKRAPFSDDVRSSYLRAWFDDYAFREIEKLRAAIGVAAGASAPILLSLASDLLREYSLQEPQDLRVRRRTSPPSSVPLLDAFETSCGRFVARLEASQDVLGILEPRGRVLCGDVTAGALSEFGSDTFDLAVTSPPYAMALPYIDTQRLSLVWLGLVPPERIRPLDAELVGSREVATSERRALDRRLASNEDGLPASEAAFCSRLARAIGPGDGFRRQAVPALLYRYLVNMRDSFAAVLRAVKPGARYALIVGHNHTVLSGKRYDIDTPTHLAGLAESLGWKVDEMVPLQTYQRYGLHASNAVKAETLMMLVRPRLV